MRTLFFALVCAGISAACARPGPERAPLALDEIQAPHISAHVKFLAHDLLEGRAPSTRGGELAAEYVAAQFAAIGLEPGGGGGTYFQQVPIIESIVDPAFTLDASAGRESRRLKYFADIVSFSGTEQPDVRVKGDLIFVGHGIVAPEFTWNDYEGVDVKGKVVLVMVNDPPAPAEEPDLFGGEALTYYGRWTYKFEEAARQGAAGAMLIHTTESATYPWQVVQSSWSGTQYGLPADPGKPALALKAWVTDEAARGLAGLGGRDLNALRASARTRGAKSVPLGVQVSAALRQTVTKKSSPNVIGLVRGTNDRQAVVFTSHYDHLGTRAGSGDQIYNGARDNASGVGGMLEVAQAFARAPAKPGRSVYFVATTAEESGLLGSEYLAAHPPLRIDQVAADINVDELNIWGRATDIVLLGADRSSLGDVAGRLAQERGRKVGPDPDPGKGFFFRSDHFPLAKAGVPAVSASDSVEFIGKAPGFAKAAHDEYNEKRYHAPADEFDASWNLSGAIEDLRFLAELGWRIAADPAMPAYRPGDQFGRERNE